MTFSATRETVTVAVGVGRCCRCKQKACDMWRWRVTCSSLILTQPRLWVVHIKVSQGEPRRAKKMSKQTQVKLAWGENEHSACFYTCIDIYMLSKKKVHYYTTRYSSRWKENWGKGSTSSQRSWITGNSISVKRNLMRRFINSSMRTLSSAEEKRAGNYLSNGWSLYSSTPRTSTLSNSRPSSNSGAKIWEILCAEFYDTLPV